VAETTLVVATCRTLILSRPVIFLSHIEWEKVWWMLFDCVWLVWSQAIQRNLCVRCHFILRLHW